MDEILAKIVARKMEEVAELKRDGVQLRNEVDPPRGFIKGISQVKQAGGLAIIAEIKKASPSNGLICHDFNPIKIAINYQKKGATAISVLTDRDFFQGDLSYLIKVREVVNLPVLQKDFIIDPIQIEEAGQAGADAILLIAAILEKNQLADYQAQAEEQGQDVLVEVHDEAEMEMVLEVGAKLIGINNRNLANFKIDIETTFRLQKMVPVENLLVSESGLKSIKEIQRLRESGVAAALIGESLMRAGADSDLLQKLC